MGATGGRIVTMRQSIVNMRQVFLRELVGLIGGG